MGGTRAMNSARARAVGLALLTCACAAPARAAPLGYLHGYGPRAYPVVALTWGVLGISIFVSVAIGVLVLSGILFRRVKVDGQIRRAPVFLGAGGLDWIAWGTLATFIILVGCVVWTFKVLATINGPPTEPKLTLEVTGQQWFWRTRYISSDPAQIFSTAGEIHIPTGEPVRVKLLSADVIHSFWVPKLSGKTDTIPGQTNRMWLQADTPGTYWGTCNIYCGVQHAHMHLLVIAESPAAFATWQANQLKPAPAPATPVIAQGERDFIVSCGACHTVRGTTAGGTLGPDLTHLMSRQMLAGGMLTNTIANLSGWIADPQRLKPGTTMPNLYLSGPQLQSIRSFLETLK